MGGIMARTWPGKTVLYIGSLVLIVLFDGSYASSNITAPTCNETITFNRTAGKVICGDTSLCVNTASCYRPCFTKIKIVGNKLMCGGRPLCDNPKPWDMECMAGQECDCMCINETMMFNDTTGEIMCGDTSLCVNTSTCNAACNETININGTTLMCGNNTLCGDPDPWYMECMAGPGCVCMCINETMMFNVTTGEIMCGDTSLCVNTSTCNAACNETININGTTLMCGNNTLCGDPDPWYMECMGNTNVTAVMETIETVSTGNITAPAAMETTATNAAGSETVVAAMETATYPAGNETIPADMETTSTNAAGSVTVPAAMETSATNAAESETIVAAMETTATNAAGGETAVAAMETTATNAAGSETVVAAMETTATNAAGSETVVAAMETTVTNAAESETVVASIETTATNAPGSQTVETTGSDITDADSVEVMSTQPESESTDPAEAVTTATQEIVPQEDDSLAVDPSNIRKDDLDTLFDNPSSDINGAIWEDLSDDLLSDPEAIEKLKEGAESINPLSKLAFELKASVSLESDTVNTGDCTSHALMCETFSKTWIDARESAELKCILAHDSCVLSETAMAYYAAKVDDLISLEIGGLSDSAILEMMGDYCCVQNGISFSTWEAIMTQYTANRMDDRFLGSLNCNCSTETSDVLRRVLKKYSDVFSADNLLAQIDEVSLEDLIAVDVNSLTSLNKSTSLALLLAVASDREEDEDNQIAPGATIKPSNPVLSILRENIKNDLNILPADDIEAFLNSGAALFIDMGNMNSDTLCGIANKRVFDQLDFAKLRAIVDMCAVQNFWGPFEPNSYTSEFAPIVRVLTADEIMAISGSPTDIESVCEYAGSYTDNQLTAIGNRVLSYLNSNGNALKDNMEKYSCVFTKLTAKLGSLPNVQTKRDFCYYLACVDASQMSSKQQIDLLDMCFTAEISPSLLKMCCSAETYRDTIISALQPRHVDLYTTKQNIIDAVGCLQVKVADCDTRQHLLSKVTTGQNALSVSNIFDLASIGSLCDHMTDFSNIPSDGIDRLTISVIETFTHQASVLEYKKVLGLPTGKLDCLKLSEAKKECVREYRAKSSSSGASGRRRRDTGITCEDIRTYQIFVPLIFSSTELASMSKTEMSNCLDILGYMDGFTEQQYTAIAEKVVMDSYWGAPNTWDQATIISLGGIVSGLSTTMLAKLNITTAEALHAISISGIWSNAEKIVEVFKQFKGDYSEINQDLAQITGSQLIFLGPFVCGMSNTEIGQLTSESYCEAATFVGRLSNCEEYQLEAFIQHVKHCFQSVVQDWTVSEFLTIGILFGGLTSNEIQMITQAQLEIFPPTLIPHLPTSTFAAFTSTQLGYLTVQQVAQMTDPQFAVLSSEDKEMLYNKLTESGDTYIVVFTDPTDNNGNNNNNNNKNNNKSGTDVIHVSLVLTLITVLTSWRNL